MTNKDGSSWIRREKRIAIYERDSYCCIYCLRDLSNVPNSMRTLDHIQPRILGGNNHANNLVTSCLTCNSSRQEKSLQEFAPGGVIERIYRQIGIELVKNKQNSREYRAIAKKGLKE